MKRWLAERQLYAVQLQQRAQLTVSRRDSAEWERYARQTARMQVVAGQLAAALPDSFSVAHGIRLSFRGREIYLEHLVIGPTGIFLIESVEDNPSWRDDLARSLDFFAQNLGAESGRLTCLVIAREVGGTAQLPPGAHLVDSLETAIIVMKDAQRGLPLPPAVAQEVWHLVGAMTAQGPLPSPLESLAEPRFSWREWVTIGAAIWLNTLLELYSEYWSWGEWVVGLIVLVGPTFWLSRFVVRWQHIRWREAASYALMILAVVVTLFGWIGAAMSA